MAKYDIGIARHASVCDCLGEPVLWTDTGTTDFFIECDVCGINGPTKQSAFEAIKAWDEGQRDEDQE